jgi:hypothetical protein
VVPNDDTGGFVPVHPPPAAKTTPPNVFDQFDQYKSFEAKTVIKRGVAFALIPPILVL